MQCINTIDALLSMDTERLKLRLCVVLLFKFQAHGGRFKSLAFLWCSVRLPVGVFAFGPWMPINLDYIFGVVEVSERNNFIDAAPVLKINYGKLHIAL